jgi:nuclear cap-binding protein subunit 1
VKAVALIFERLEELDLECYMSFTEWFAHHLSNFEYKWAWAQWVATTDRLRRDFISEVVFRCIRFAGHDRLEKVVPPELLAFFPPKPIAHFKYLADPSTPGLELAQSVYNRMKSSEAPEHLVDYLGTQSATTNTSSFVVIDVLTTCLLQIGEKSYTHLQTNLTKYLPLVSKYVTDGGDAAQQRVLLSLLEFWRSSPQRIVMALDIFLTVHLVSPGAVIDFVFSAETASYQTRLWLWELLALAFDKSLSEEARMRAHFESLPNPNTIQSSVVNIEEIESYSSLEDDLDVKVRSRQALFAHLSLAFKARLISLASSGSSDDDKYKYRFLLGMFKAFCRKHYEHLRPTLSQFSEMFADVNDPRMVEVATELISLATNY